MMSDLLLLVLLLLAPLSEAVGPSCGSSASGQPRPGSPEPAAVETCRSVECVKLAAEIISYMNTSVEPCDDFYSYACGNFPNVAKYNPKSYDLFQDTTNQMIEQQERNIYELLILHRLATSPDKDIADLYNFTRVFYSSCRDWMLSRRYMRRSNQMEFMTISFLRGVIDHLNDTLTALTREDEPISIETVLAALVKTGGRSLLTVQIPYRFATKVLTDDDYNLTQTARAVIDLGIDYMESVDGEQTRVFRGVLDIVAKSQLGLSLGLNFSGRLETNAQVPPFAAEISRIKQALEAELLKFANCSHLNTSKTRFTVSELDQIASCAAGSAVPFSWRRFFEDLLQTPVDPNALVELKTVHKVTRFVNYLKSLSMFSDTIGEGDTVSDDVTFLVFDWLLSFHRFFPGDLRSSWFDKHKPFVLSPYKDFDSVEECIGWTKELLQPVLERMYQAAYHGQDFAGVARLVQLVKDAAVWNVLQQAWITPSAKEAIVKKIHTMKQSIGLDQIPRDEFVSFYASTLKKFRALQPELHNLESGFGSLFSLALCAFAHRNFDLMSGISRVTMFVDISSMEVNAFNWVGRNQIIFPMAIVAPTFYHPTYPDYANLGKLGTIIGHEIGHSFDDYGHTLNLQGAIGHFWDNDTELRYLERMECVRRRYGSYRLYPDAPLHPSNSTLSNDISDIMGLEAAYRALKMQQLRRRKQPRLPNLPAELTPERLLFIQAAQCWCVKMEPSALEYFGEEPSHSLNQLRVRGMIENSREFAKVFGCGRGRPMNPEVKCSFW